MGSFTRAAQAAFCVVALAVVVAGCGKADEETVQSAPLPTVEVGKLKYEDIKPVAQAPKFEGFQKDVASDMDRIIAAINADDAKFLCTEGYSKEDIAILDKDGQCAKAVLRFLQAYGGYRLDITEIKVKGDTARAQTRVITAYKKEQDPIEQLIPFKFVKQDGHWRMNLGLEQRLEQAPPSSDTGSIEDDPSTPENEATEPRENSGKGN